MRLVVVASSNIEVNISRRKPAVGNLRTILSFFKRTSIIESLLQDFDEIYFDILFQLYYSIQSFTGVSIELRYPFNYKAITKTCLTTSQKFINYSCNEKMCISQYELII